MGSLHWMCNLSWNYIYRNPREIWNLSQYTSTKIFMNESLISLQICLEPPWAGETNIIESLKFVSLPIINNKANYQQESK